MESNKLFYIYIYNKCYYFGAKVSPDTDNYKRPTTYIWGHQKVFTISWNSTTNTQRKIKTN